MKTKAIKYPYYWLALTMCISLAANAQKLPNVQASGLYAPANVKVDGKATEWGNQLQAYNKSTSLFYTMANNNDNLYLAIQATDRVAIEKMLGGGITFTITNKNSSVSITTPSSSAPNRANIVKALRSAEPVTEDLLNELNKGLVNNFKEISLEGIGAISQPILSVYNDYGIKVTALLDINKTYTCELAIPIKYFTQLVSDIGSFDYNIKLNGLKFNFTNSNGQPGEIPPLVMAAGPMAGGPSASGGNGQASNNTSVMDLINATDFSGTYTLSKNKTKP